MSTRPRPIVRVGTIVALGMVLSLGAFQGLGEADIDPKPRDRVSGTVTDATSQLPSQDSPSEPATSGQPEQEATSGTTEASSQSTAQSAGATGITDDSPGHETPEPGPPDHARGAIAEVSLAGNNLVAVGQTNAQINDDGTSQGDVTVLSLGGQEIIGAHSDSEGEESSSVDPFAPLCEGSGGGICLGLLFADTNSSNSSTASHSDASTAVVAACIGGTNPEPGVTCDGQVSAGVARSSSNIDRDKSGGSETATQETDLADACVGGENEDGVCQGVGATAIHSESTSTVDGNQAQTEESSYLANVQLGGMEFVVISDPTAITLPPGCPQGASLLCVFFNQGTEVASAGTAGSRQEALHVDVLPGVVGGENLSLAHAGIAETRVSAFGGPVCPPEGEDDEDDPDECPPDDEDEDECPGDDDCPRAAPGGPAVTGANIRLGLGILGLLFASGTSLVAVSRRRRSPEPL